MSLSKIRTAARMLLTMDEKDPKRIFEGEALLRRMYRYGLLVRHRARLQAAAVGLSDREGVGFSVSGRCLRLQAADAPPRSAPAPPTRLASGNFGGVASVCTRDALPACLLSGLTPPARLPCRTRLRTSWITCSL